MQAFTEARSEATPDEIWLCEHAPVYTQGLAGKAAHVLDARDIPVVQTNRGGQVTYHGPGQVVAYPLIDLRAPGHLRQGICVPARAGGHQDARGVRRHRASRGRRARHLRAPRRPFGHAVLATPEPGQDPFAGLGKIAALGIKVSRHCAYHGVALNVDMDLRPFDGINPCGYAGLADRGPFYNRRPHDVGRSSRRTRRQARNLPRPVTQRATEIRMTHRRRDHYDATYDPKQKAQAKTSSIPIKVVAAETLEEARLDPRQGRVADVALLRDQAHPARAQAAHGVRRSVLPEHRRMLRQGHGDVHDHGRQVHAALPLLRCRPWPARPAGCRRTAEPGEDDRCAEAQVRRDHQRRSRRPARRRRGAFRRLHREDARTVAADAHRDPDARLPRPYGSRARHPAHGAARCDEP